MDLPEKSTVWIKGDNDGFGGFTWSEIFVIDCRIAYKDEVITDGNGDRVTTTAVLYTDSNRLVNGALVLLGYESFSPEPPPDANDVRKIAATPSGTNLIKGWLS